MKVTDLIRVLNKVQSKYGNIDVAVYNTDTEDYMELTGIDIQDNNLVINIDEYKAGYESIPSINVQ